MLWLLSCVALLVCPWAGGGCRKPPRTLRQEAFCGGMRCHNWTVTNLWDNKPWWDRLCYVWRRVESCTHWLMLYLAIDANNLGYLKKVTFNAFMRWVIRFWNSGFTFFKYTVVIVWKKYLLVKRAPLCCDLLCHICLCLKNK